MTFFVVLTICVLLFILIGGLGHVRTVYADFEYVEIPEHIQTEVLKHCDCAPGEEHGPYCAGAKIADHYLDMRRERE